MSHKTAAVTVPLKSPRRVGVVESDKRLKTRTVVVNFVTKHPKYGKYVKKRTVLHVHDEKNESGLGDRVEVAECRPIAARKTGFLFALCKRRQSNF